MRSLVGIAIEPASTENSTLDPLRLEIDGIREIELEDAKLTLLLLRWSPDGSPIGDFLRSLMNGSNGKEEETA